MSSFAGPFRMPINEAFHIKPIDRIVAVGLIAEGSVEPGDNLFVRSRLGSFPVVVEKLEHPTQELSIAKAGQEVGLMLNGVGPEHVQAGDVIVAESMVDPAKVKEDSERIIARAGGKICDWLPWIEHSELRARDEIVGRALVMNALLNIYFKAPIPLIRGWITENGVESYLCDWEREILEKNNEELSEQEVINLYWHIEALWALMWIGSLVEELPFDRPVEDYMATLTPNLQQNEDGSKFSENMRVRSYGELYWMRDVYYRIHWYARDGQLNGYPTGNVSLDIVMERRKALEWAMDSSSDWDTVDLST